MIRAKSYYLPATDAEKAIWLNNFSIKLGTYAAALGVSPLEVTATHNDCAFFRYIIDMLESAKQNVNNITVYKEMSKHSADQQRMGPLPTLPAIAPPPVTVPDGIFDRVSKLVQRIKASPNYSDPIGQDLGIIRPERIVDLHALRPVLKVKLNSGHPQIKCTKGVADAIDLYVNRKDGAGFVLIGRLLKTEYRDMAEVPAATPLVEWDYKAIYVVKNANVGSMSDVVSIMVKKF